MRAPVCPIWSWWPRQPRLVTAREQPTVPPGRGRQAELLGEGPDAAPAVVELFKQLGVA